MGRRSLPFLAITLLLLPLPLSGLASADGPQASSVPVRFGMDVASMDALAAAGAPADLAVFWVGSWMERYGWGGFDSALDKASRTNTTLVVQFWYWGDAISPDCVENGCHDKLQNVTLTRAKWDQMADTIASKVQAKMGGREVIVIVETEFNKGGIDASWYAPTFDGYLAAKMDRFHQVPGIRTAIGFGNWGQDRWDRFPEAIARSDFLGFQAMRGSTRDTLSSYTGAIDAIRSASSYLHTRFGKPTLLHDLALSTYPEPEYLEHQAAEVRELFARLPELQAAGVQGIVYRALTDNPNFNTANYYGEAERYWGLRRADGTLKPALQHWIDGVQVARYPVAWTAQPWLVQEAESFPTKTTGGTSDSGSPSGGNAWNIWSNGEIRTTADVPHAGEHLVTIRARGDLAGAELPRMVLKVDGASVRTWNVGRTVYADYQAVVQLPEGPRELAIAFVNDHYSTAGDRNLHVDVVSVAALTAPPQAEPVPEPQPEPEPEPANEAPSARFTLRCDWLACAFDAGASFDRDGVLVSYGWDFGDGGVGSGSAVSHAFATKGRYPVTLVVTDDRGAQGMLQQVVEVVHQVLLRAEAAKVKGLQKVDLTWEGATGSEVVVERDGLPLARVPNTGAWRDNLDRRGGGTYAYRVCETGADAVCSDKIVVLF